VDEDAYVTFLLHMESEQNTHARQSIDAGNLGLIDGLINGLINGLIDGIRWPDRWHSTV